MDHPPLSHHPHRRLYSPLPDIAPAPFAPSLFEFIYETSWEEMEDSSDKMAILDASTGQSRTFAECYQTATGLAGALKYDYHVSTSSCVAVVCPNHVDYLSIALAVSLCGAMLTTVDSQCSLQELEHVLKQSQASVLVVHASLMEIAKQVVDALTNSVKHCIVVTDGYFEPELVPKAMVSLDKLRHHNKAFFRSDNSNYKDCDQSPYLVTFPSESSIPVILTQGNLIASMLQLKQVDELNEQVDETSSSSSFMNHKVLSPLPFSDVYGFTVSLLYAAWTGQTLVTMSRRFDYDRIYKAIATYKPKRALLDPLMLMEMAEGPVDDEFDLSSLDSILCAALPSTNSSAEAFAKRIGCRLQQFWGVGELAPVVAYGCNATMAGIAGSLVPSTAVKIVNESGKSLGPNESGQVLVKGPQVVSRRWNQDNQSLDSAGWLRIGYTGYFDKMGHLHVADFPHDMSEHQLFEEAVILAGRSLVEEAMKKDEPTNPKTGLQFMVESI